MKSFLILSRILFVKKVNFRAEFLLQGTGKCLYAIAFCGVVAWQYAEHFMSDALVPAQLVGLGSAIVGMIVGSLAPTLMGGQGHPEIVDQARQPEVADNPPA